MHELYRVIADPDNGEMLTLIFFGLIFLAYLLFKRDVIDKQLLTPTGFDKAQMYASAAIAFFCGIILFGKIFVPKNAEDLLSILGLSDFLKNLTLNFQAIVLGLLGLLL